MPSNANTREFQPQDLVSDEQPGVPLTAAAPDLRRAESGLSDSGGQDVSFTIVDDPKNESVYKGAGSYAATRAESAVHDVEKAFPPLRFELRFEKNLSALHVQARVPPSVENEVFLSVLSKALASTATRLAPVVGELRGNAVVASDRA